MFLTGMTDPGTLMYRVTLQRVKSTKGATGSATESLSVLGKVWAGIKDTSMSERARANNMEAVSDYRVTIRHRKDVTADDRILGDLGEGGPLAGKTARITSVTGNRRDGWSFLECKTSSND